MTTPQPYRKPDLAKKHLLLPNRYRIGDSVAVMLLRQWVEDRYGAKDWYLQYPNSTLGTLSQFIEADWQWYGAHLAYNDDGTLKEHIEVFDDVNLWVWNDVFYHSGQQLEFHVPELEGLPKVLFAPLLEVDYAPERTMHPLFAAEIAERLKGDNFAVLLPESLNNGDRKDLEATGANLVTVDTLADAATLIGNADIYIGGDTGFSHIAGRFPHLRQIALHDRGNTARHCETIYDHSKASRERILEIVGEWHKRDVEWNCPAPRYRSTPCKSCIDIYFNHHGMDNSTADQVVGLVERWRETENVQ